MNLRDVLFTALNHRSLQGDAVNKDLLDYDVIQLFEANGVDVDEVIEDVDSLEESFDHELSFL